MKAYKISSSVVYYPDNGMLIFNNNEQVLLDNRLRLTLNTLLFKNNTIVSKQELLEEVWESYPGAENSLHNAISQLRKLLRDEKLIKTYPKVGYSLSGDVRELTKKLSLPKKFVSIISILILFFLGYTFFLSPTSGHRGKKFLISLEQRAKIDSLKQLPQLSDSALHVIRKSIDSLKNTQ